MRFGWIVAVCIGLSVQTGRAEGFGAWADALKCYESSVVAAVTQVPAAELSTEGHVVSRVSVPRSDGSPMTGIMAVPIAKAGKKGIPLLVLLSDTPESEISDLTGLDKWAFLVLRLADGDDLLPSVKLVKWAREQPGMDERRLVLECSCADSAAGLGLSALARGFARTAVLIPSDFAKLERSRQRGLEAMIFALRHKTPVRIAVGCRADGGPSEEVQSVYEAIPVKDKAIRIEPGMVSAVNADARAALRKWLVADKIEPLDASHPDYVVFRPHQLPSCEFANPALRGDTYNDHFHVIWDGKRRRYYAFWTQGTVENAVDMHVCLSMSDDRGRTWTEPMVLAGCETVTNPCPRAVWQQPMLSKSGRLYCLFNQQTTDHPLHHGELFGVYSDDGGKTWSKSERIPMKRMLRDDPDPAVPPQWCNWQRPLRLGKNGRFLVGCTRHGNKPGERQSTRVEFWEFENIDSDPEVRNIRLGYYATNEDALTVRTGKTDVQWCEEAGIVKLPDGRLFALMRTRFKHPYWSQSRDDGRTWSRPQPLRDAAGRPFYHPCSPCPIYDWKGCEAASGMYFALIHNAYDESLPLLKKQKRGPLYLIAGKFDPDGEQPIRFSTPKIFSHVRYGNACYSSYTVSEGEGVLWFAHQKHTLVGRRIGPEWLKFDEEPDLTGKKVLPETQLFFQAQLYPWREQARGYLGRYLNQPLLVDPDLPMDEDRDGIDPMYGWGMFPSQADYDKTMEYAAQYGVDGLSLFTRRPQRYFRSSARCPTKSMKVVPVVMFQHPEDHKEEVRGRYSMEENSNGFFHNGKQLVLSYWVEHCHTPESFRQRCETIRRKVPGEWMFVASLPSLVDFRAEYVRNGGKMSADIEDAIRKRVAAWAKVADGIQVCEAHMNHKVEHGERVFAAEYWRDLNRLVVETLRSGEFAGKKLYCTAAVNGHLNSYQTGYNTSENCTKTLRDSMETALMFDPDVVLMPEWDEHNENTSFAPTLYGGWSVKRIVRYYADRMKHRPLSPVEGDDVSIPNLIVSYRKSVSPGEMLIVEVLNVPDGSRSGGVSVSVSVSDENGGELKRFPAAEIDESKLSECRCEIDTAEMAQRARALRVRLEWKKGGSRGAVCEGLHPIDLQPASSWNHLCVKTSLRDLAHPTKTTVDPKGGRFRVRLENEEPIRYAMLCGNGEIQYIQGRKGADPDRFREDETCAAFAVSLIGPNRCEAKKGKPFTWRVKGARDAEWLYYTGVTKGETFETDDINGVATPPVYLRLPKSRLRDAVLEIDLPGIYAGKVPLAEAYDRQAYAVGESVKKTMVTVTRFALQSRYPSVANAREIDFDVIPCSDRNSMLYHVQFVTMSGKVWHSRPFVVEKKEDAVLTRAWSSMSDSAVEVRIPAARVPFLRYDFSPVAGNVIPVESGERHWFGMAGGPVTPVTLWNRGARTEGGLCGGVARTFEEQADSTVPMRVREPDGSWALQFDGIDDYANFPSEAWPATGGATVEFDVWRDSTQAEGSALFRFHRDVGMGMGLRITDEGLLLAYFCGIGVEDVETDPVFLPPDEWHRIRLVSSCDRMSLYLDGRHVSSKPISNPSRYLVPSMLGGYPREGFFRGRIRRFVIRHDRTIADENSFVDHRVGDARYETLNPHFAKAFEFLRRKDLAKLPVGRYEIDGSNCWAMVQTVNLTPMEKETTVEAHRKYIDIQAPITGDETIGLCAFDTNRTDLVFNEKKDIVFFKAKVEPRTLHPGEFAIFFPRKDAHAPGHCVDETQTIRKLVIKVREE